MEPDRRRALHQLGARQHGLVTFAQLVATGWSRWSWSRARSTGALIPVARHVALLPGARAGTAMWALAACLETGGVASHRTAAWAHRLWPLVERIEVLVERPARPARELQLIGGPPVTIHTTTNLHRDDVLRIDGVPTTSVARTLLSLGALVPDGLSQERLQELVGEAIDKRAASLEWLWWILEVRRCRGRDGVAAFQAALEVLSDLGPTESWLERYLLDLLRRRGVPLPATQRVVRRSGRFVARVDLLWEQAHLVVEVLGHAYHRTPRDLQRDAARANALQLQGYLVLQFTYDDLLQRPDEVIAAILAALARPRRRR